MGVDIIEVGRIEAAIQRWGMRFVGRVYTEEELFVCGKKAPMLAARFAGKEAVMKVLGVGRRGIAWREVEVIAGRDRKPSVRLHGRAQALAWRLRMDDFDISLSHTREYAIAVVVGELK